MMYFINIFEALISVWAISELCDIKKKSSFIIITTFLSFAASYICDLFNGNSWPLLMSYILIWFLMASLYAKKSYLYNFFIVLVCNYIISLSAILPLIFLYDKSAIMASLAVRVIHFCICYLFVMYRRRYSYVENRYWIPVLIILAGCMFVLEDKIYSYFDASLSINIIFEIVILFGISCTALFFFHIIERFAEDKNMIEKKLMKERYKNLSYDIIKFSKRELDYLHHGLTYKLMLVKDHLDKENYSGANKIVSTYLQDINKYSNIITTGNEVFDIFFLINTSNINYNLIKVINIPEREYYNSMEFINLISGLINLIKDETTVFFNIEDKGIYCLITLSSKELFFNKENLEYFLDKYSDDYSAYVFDETDDLYSVKVNIRVKNESDM